MIYPSILVFLIGGMAGRIRGGELKDLPWIPDSLKTTHFGRAVWAFVVMAVFAVCTREWLYTPLVGILAFVGTLHGYLGGEFAVGELKNKNWRNYAWLTLASSLRLILLVIAFATTPYASGFIYGLIASLFFVPCYLLGVPMTRHFPVFGYTQWGEFFVYGLMLMGIFWGL